MLKAVTLLVCVGTAMCIEKPKVALRKVQTKTESAQKSGGVHFGNTNPKQEEEFQRGQAIIMQQETVKGALKGDFSVLTSTKQDQLKIKPVCSKASQFLAGGSWRKLSATEYDLVKSKTSEPLCRVSGENLGTDRKMVYEPSQCSMPMKASLADVKPRRVLFVGDSLTEHHAIAFAQDFAGSNVSLTDYKLCDWTSEKPLKASLKDAGFSTDIIDRAYPEVKWMSQAHGEDIKAWGCGGNDKVSFLRLNRLPGDPEMSKVVMHLIKKMSPEPLGAEDVVVMNFGQWYESAYFAPSKPLELLVKEMKKGKQAPRLVYRQITPGHYGAFSGGYTHGESRYSCREMSGPEINVALHKKEVNPSINDAAFYKAVKDAGHEIDGVNIAYLPVWGPTAERFDEHAPLHGVSPASEGKLEADFKEQGQYKADCLHYCIQSSVYRFYNSALISVIGGMMKGEVKV